MNITRKDHNTIHRLLFTTANQAHLGVERWFIKEKIGVTHLQFGILRHIAHGNMTLNELARRMLFKPPSLLPSIDTLERKGYIARRNDPKDRRKIRLLMTKKGEKIVEQVTASIKFDPLSVAFKKLGPIKRKRILSLLTELHGILSANQ